MNTIFDKIWERHEILKKENGESILYVDRHLLHEVTSAQAFSGLLEKNRIVKFSNQCLGVIDHNLSTKNRKDRDASGPISKTQMERMEENCKHFGIRLYGFDDPDQGIAHVLGPEIGFTLPGTIIVCGDSHTSTHGAFGSLAFGIGTSEVEHVLATQTLVQRKPKSMKVRFVGNRPEGISAKDIALYLIETIGTSGGRGHVIEYTGSLIETMTMDERMTLCNLTVEAGARAGIIAPDEVTYAYLRGRELSPKAEQWKIALRVWKDLKSSEEATYDKEIDIYIDEIAPKVTWGTNPSQTISISESIPELSYCTPNERLVYNASLEYMGLVPGKKMTEVEIDKVFIGSCTNSRIEDLRDAAKIAKGRKVKSGVQALVVPGSGRVKRLAELEGLDKVFTDAGFEWRNPGCSMCLAMNDDILKPGERCASTSNRNFEGRQGLGGRTHLVSPRMAAAAAIAGKFVDVRLWREL
jgi:3-isopropylmalate/(R)-2-methylmalate dehydratase large subunit